MLQTTTNLSQVAAKVEVVRPKVSLNDGLPKIDPKLLVEELKSVLYSNDNMRKYFPDEVEKKYRDNFALFDRDGDERINYAELKELLVSIGQIFDDKELLELYEELQEPDNTGMRSDNLFILVSKNIRDNDQEEQLIEAFRTVDKENIGYINDESFKEQLMTMGCKWSEEETDEFMKFCNPKFGDAKSEGKFLYMDVVKKLLKP